MIKCDHFDLEELVSEKVFKKYGQGAWAFFDPRALMVLDWLREAIDRPITINNWVWGGDLDERGFRSNLDSIVKNKTDEDILYCSAHMRGMAFDLNVEGMTTQEVKDWLDANKDSLPYNIRIEENTHGWLHFDVVDKGVRIYKFAA